MSRAILMTLVVQLLSGAAFKLLKMDESVPNLILFFLVIPLVLFFIWAFILKKRERPNKEMQ